MDVSFSETHPTTVSSERQPAAHTWSAQGDTSSQKESASKMKTQFAGNVFVNIPKIKLEFREGQGEKVAKCQQNWEMLSKHLTSSANTKIASPVKFN